MGGNKPAQFLLISLQGTAESELSNKTITYTGAYGDGLTALLVVLTEIKHNDGYHESQVHWFQVQPARAQANRLDLLKGVHLSSGLSTDVPSWYSQLLPAPWPRGEDLSSGAPCCSRIYDMLTWEEMLHYLSNTMF